jgi:hypothetical protein
VERLALCETLMLSLQRVDSDSRFQLPENESSIPSHSVH